MARKSTTKTGLETAPREDFLLAGRGRLRAPVVARRGISETEARQIYLDYINRAQPADNRGPCEVAWMT